jgi:uncharacterized protein YndB with AHSA1/START domain
VSQHPISLEHAADVPASPDDVWPLLADPTRRPSWMTELRRVEAEPGLLVVGDRFDGQSSILLHDFIGSSEVTEAEPGRSLAEQVVIGARFVSRWELTATADGGTRVHHAIDVQFPDGPFSPLERWVLRRRLVRMQRASLRNLAARLASH